MRGGVSVKLTIDQRAFAAALAAGGSAVARGSAVAPILTSIRLIAEGGALRVASTNLDQFVEAKAEAEVAKPGAITVPAARLVPLMAKFPTGATVTLEMDGPHLKVKCGRSNSKLSTLPAKDFPAWADDAFASRFVISQETFAETLGRGRQATTNDQAFAFLAGVYMHREGDRLTFASTNRFVVSVIEIEPPEGAESVPGVIVPAVAIDTAGRVLKGCGDITVEASGSKVAFEAGPVRVVSKVIEGPFPDFRRLMPARGAGAPLDIARRDFADGIDRAELATEEGTFSAVICIPRGEAIELKGANSLGGEVREEVEADVAPEFRAFGFNPRYMRIALAAFGDAERVTVEQSDPQAPHLFWSEETPDVLMALATVRINAQQAA